MTRSTRDRFIGRAAERELLGDRLRAAAGGAGQVVLVAGEPGVGKTRLAEETVAEARALGMATAWGRSTMEAGSPPYWPFRQLARALGSAGDLSFVDDAEARERFRLFESVTDRLGAAAGPDGLLVVLDDIQWADPASTGLLTHLAMGIADTRLMVLATYRDTETHDSLRTALARLAREPLVTRIRLTGLAEPEVAQHLAGVTGWAVPAPVAAAVCRRTGGNPFFVGELGRLLAGAQDHGRLPDGVRDAVHDRLARLSALCQEVLATAAVLGSEVDAPAVAFAAGLGVAEVLTALDEATAAGIVGGGRFTHDLIRESARLEVATARRLVLHQRMAEHLMSRSDTDAHVAEIAFHLFESLPSGDAATAAEWAERAADQAMAQLAWEEADELYGRALATGARPAPADRCRLLLAQVGARVRAYDMDGARQSLMTAAELARREGDAETIARAVLTMEGVTDFLWDPIGRALCEEALAGIDETDSALRARLLALRVSADAWRSSSDIDTRSAEALAMAERVGDRRAIVEALRARQMARSGPDGAADRLALGDRLLAVGQDDDSLLWGHLWRFDALAQLGEIDRAEAELEPIMIISDRLRSPLARWHACRSRAAIAAVRGRFAEAIEIGTQSKALATTAGHEGALFPSAGFLMGMRALTGALDDIPEDLVEWHTTNVAKASTKALFALWELMLGNREKAERLYRALPSFDTMPAFMLLSALAGTAELAAEFGDRATAAEIHRRLAPYADLFACGGAGVVAITGSARLGLGLAAATLGRLDDAVRSLREAVEANERAGVPPWTATARYHLATVLARRKRTGDLDEAAALATSVAAVAGKLGMTPLCRRAQELGDSLSGNRGNAKLTRREQQIAELVSQGLTNRQIAAAAHIGERTVETHVQHVLGKLGFGNRSQIAAWVASGEMGTEAP
ncbi:regulatory protein, luxR family [Amycolatopsis xylanica]|uniref:Regulatory protein, luxR family n=1 Tax=Amycolatopsis xylanica TaxID=589385 RepID=A0A1H3RKQ4_9PSEU|nr:LuxR family transcriptional regulator [Amycolatopsis xylanica]SDZ26183.1 regulatory protein, luxR family [Amycolatopsis xylanica]